MRRFLNYFRRIRVRLTLWYVLLLAVVLIVFSAVLYVSLRSSLLSEVDSSISNTAGQVVTNLENENDHLSFQNSEEPVNLLNRLAAQGYAVRLTDQKGKMIQEVGVHSAVFKTGDVPEKGFETVSAGGADWRIYTIEKSIPGGKTSVFLQLGESLDRTESTLSRLLVLEMIIIPVVLVLALAGGMFLAGRALGPIKKITRLADSTEAVDLSRRLDLDLPEDEVGMLARTFNGMLGRLEEAFNSQKRFVSEAAHELRTPLTIMKGTTDVALGKERTPAEYREVLGELRVETDHLIGLAEDLLALSRAESESAVLRMTDIDLSEIVRSSVERITPLAHEKGMRIEFQGDSSLPFRGDPDKLARLYINLLDNAVRYSPENSTITVSMSRDNNNATVSVSDEGPGLPGGELDDIFDSFHRLDVARETNPSGVGLGLSISLWIARAHGGDIHVESKLGKGSTFTVILPLPQANLD